MRVAVSASRGGTAEGVGTGGSAGAPAATRVEVRRHWVGCGVAVGFVAPRKHKWNGLHFHQKHKEGKCVLEIPVRVGDGLCLKMGRKKRARGGGVEHLLFLLYTQLHF